MRKVSSYSRSDFEKLCENEYNRYPKNSAKIGHALIKNEAGKKIAYQYGFVEEEGAHSSTTPRLRPLETITEIKRFGLNRYEGKSPKGTLYVAKRTLDLQAEDGTDMSLAYFSPRGEEEPFWGNEKSTPLFRNDLSEDAFNKLNEKMKMTSLNYKGGEETTLIPKDITIRDATSRSKSQNAVMDHSAKEHFSKVLREYSDVLHPEMVKRLQRSADAVFRDEFSWEGQFRPEWLHALANGLTPSEKDPQVKENLGAAHKWCNTEMMILERIAKYFAMKGPEYIVAVKPLFHMLLDSEIIHKIEMDNTIQSSHSAIKLFMNIDPFKEYPVYHKASDVAQGTLVVHEYLNQSAPVSTIFVKKEQTKPERIVQYMDIDTPAPGERIVTIGKKRKREETIPIPERIVTILK